MKKILIVIILITAFSFSPKTYQIKLDEKEVNTMWRQLGEIDRMVIMLDMNNKFNVNLVSMKIDSVKQIIYRNVPDSIKQKK